MSEPIRFLRVGDVMHVTGLARATVYWLAREGRFPKPIRISKRSSAWLESEVVAWQEAHIAERDKAVTA